MRHSRDVILARVRNVASRVFVMDFSGVLVGSIFTQTIECVNSIMTHDWAHEDELLHGEGKVLQLLRVSTLLNSCPQGCIGIPVGAILRDVCLKYAQRLGFEEVCAVTRTTDYARHEAPKHHYEQYVMDNLSLNQHADRGLNFHISKGATIVTLLPQWRPEDADNCGYGTLIKYKLSDVLEQVCAY